MNDEAYERQKAQLREKYATDPEYRKAKSDYHKRWREMVKADKKRLEKHRAESREYYYRNREAVLAKAKIRNQKKKTRNHEEVQN